jgi:thiol:disulfide interchange protein
MNTKNAVGAALLAMLAVLIALPSYPRARDIYPPVEQAEADIAAALKSAAGTHKRVILDFGGNWCSSCHAFDFYIHDAANKPILDANYVLVHINVGQLDQNVEIAARYGVPVKEGAPALVVLDPRGKLLYRQTTPEWKVMNQLKANGVTQFLMKWKPSKAT